MSLILNQNEVQGGRTHLDDGARLLALLATLLWLALVRRDDSNTGELVRHDCESSGLEEGGMKEEVMEP